VVDPVGDLTPDTLDVTEDTRHDDADGARDADATHDLVGHDRDPDTTDAARPYPEPGAWPPNRGPGAPNLTFDDEALFVNCAFLDGGELDESDHHNLVTMYDGYLLMPWAPEFAAGGLTFWEISDPCAPSVVGTGFDLNMRETHSIGFSNIGGRWAVVNGMETIFEGGIQFWDVSDPSAPEAVANLNLEGFFYPDAYARVVLSVFWQAPYVYVAHADNGVRVVDATDPLNAVEVGQYSFEPTLRAGQVQVVGNLLIVTAAEGARTALLDVSDPAHPQPIPGGDFLARDGEGEARDAYFTNFQGGHVYYARKESGGGLIIYDVSDPTNPTYSGDYHSDGNGGYVFIDEGFAFTGESSFAAIYDVSDHADISEVARLDLEGDLDTMTPVGNVVVLSVDDEARPDQGSAIAPWRRAPDTAPPLLDFVYPPDGSSGLRTSSRVGLGFNEPIDVASAWEGSVRMYVEGTDPASTRVDLWISTQEVIVNAWPQRGLEPNTTYVLEVPAGGVADWNGNTVAETFSMTFATGAE